MSRTAEVKRTTKETDIYLFLDLDGTGKSDIDTGCGFLDHMLTLFSRHSMIDLKIKCTGDTYVDYHHTVEDIGIALGSALLEALGDCAGITRYGNMILPMDEALILVATDFSGRSYLGYDVTLNASKVGDFDTELSEEFFMAVARNAMMTIHIRQLAGNNTHHIIEGIFKGFGRAIRQAVSEDPRLGGQIPSTKGVLI